MTLVRYLAFFLGLMGVGIFSYYQGSRAGAERVGKLCIASMQEVGDHCREKIQEIGNRCSEKIEEIGVACVAAR